jgi:CRISPR/Cas system CSM-associated protein Csm3 (group 7 of RAMP superfamily)
MSGTRPSGKIRLTCHLAFLPAGEWLIKGASQQHSIDQGPLTDLDSQPYIPASTLKGNLRHRFRQLASLHPRFSEYETRLFGTGGQQNGQLYVDDATLNTSLSPELLRTVRTRIAMDRRRRVAADTALIFEEVVRSGTRMSSELMCYVHPDEKEDVAACLALAVLKMDWIGSGRSIGRGQLSFVYDEQLHPSKSTVHIRFEGEPWTKEAFTRAAMRLFSPGEEQET